jgi:hypothetical protein
MSLQHEIRELQILLLSYQLRIDQLMSRLLNELGSDSDEDDDDSSTEAPAVGGALCFAHIELEDDELEHPQSPPHQSGKYRKR